MNKHLKRMALAVCIGLSISSSYDVGAEQEPETFLLHTHEPQSILNAVFYAARSQDLGILSVLCDPKGQGDGDTRMVCSVGTPEAKSELKAEFIKAFATGKITGKTVYAEVKGVSVATIPFDFLDPKKNKVIHEEMNLVQRYGNWYLAGF